MTTQNPAWLAVNRINGTGNGEIIVYANNNFGNYRWGGISVTANSSPQRSFVMHQNSGGVLSLSTDRGTSTPSASYGIVGVASNRSWTVTSNDTSWLNTTHTSGTGSGEFAILVEENTSSSQREGIITVKSAGLTDQTIRITQEGATATLTVSRNLWEPNNTASTAVVTLTASRPWTATPSHSWISVSPTMGISGSRSLVIRNCKHRNCIKGRLDNDNRPRCGRPLY